MDVVRWAVMDALLSRAADAPDTGETTVKSNCEDTEYVG
jgi:hypothetical protein